jgi:hypothetical protein
VLAQLSGGMDYDRALRVVARLFSYEDACCYGFDIPYGLWNGLWTGEQIISLYRQLTLEWAGLIRERREEASP